jgi:preprotein translocase subunit SecG
MNVFFSIIILTASVLLILIVLIQNSKGGGLASGFSSSNQIMGVRKTTDFLEKATWVLAGTVIAGCILIAKVIPRQPANLRQQSELQQQVQDTQVNPEVLGTDFGTAQPDETVPLPEGE